MDIKNEILWRLYMVLLVVICLALVIFLKAVKIQVVEGHHWRERSDSLHLKYQDINADRGNIFAEDGSLLATSLPYFDIYMDTKAANEELFLKHVDTLAYCLATFVNRDYTVGGYKQYLVEARADNKRYLPIKKDATYPELEQIKSFPLFNLGANKGGFIQERKSRRKRPFRMLAHRTIGYVRADAKPVGLEGAYNEILQGEQGKRLVQKVSGNTWIPVSDISHVEPKSGHDVLTTIDVNLQDIVGNALLKGVNKHDAKYGTAVLMEVNTGAIRAIANIGRTEKNEFWETYNYAIGTSTEPGSTYKIAAIMALLEDGHITLNDTIDLEGGKTMFYEEEMVDASFHQLNKTTIRKAVEISSNVGVAKLTNKYYNQKETAHQFVNHLKRMGLDTITNIEIEGEAKPFIKTPNSQVDNWSGTTIPWMSIGYEVQITPLQLLMFYNAIANNGRMMKPYLVSEIQDFGESYKHNYPTVLNREIASLTTIKEIQSLLEGIVENGTARNISTDHYKIAGKTGTTQINYARLAKQSDMRYQASFVGYFPAEKPMYSCIVIINDPKQNGRYGSEVAAPIFKEIADKCYATHIELHPATNAAMQPTLVAGQLPSVEIGDKSDMQAILNYLELPYSVQTEGNWTVVRPQQDTLTLMARTIKEEEIPNVVGMGLRDAIYVLENKGLKVSISGFGKVAQQSIRPGTLARGQSIKLKLK